MKARVWDVLKAEDLAEGHIRRHANFLCSYLLSVNFSSSTQNKRRSLSGEPEPERLWLLGSRQSGGQDTILDIGIHSTYKAERSTIACFHSVPNTIATGFLFQQMTSHPPSCKRQKPACFLKNLHLFIHSSLNSVHITSGIYFTSVHISSIDLRH